MVRLFKMAADVCLLLWVFGLDRVKVSLDPVHTPQLGLSNILFSTCFARYAVDNVWTFTGYIFPGYITAACISAGYSAAVIQNCTIFTIFGFAFLARIAIEFSNRFNWFLNCWDFGPDQFVS